MVKYVRAESPDTSSQLLQVSCGGRAYTISILHATLDERRQTVRRSYAREHVHDLYHLLLFTRGSNRVLMNGHRIAVQAGSLLVTHPGETHDFGPCLSGELGYHEVTFSFQSGAHLLKLPSHALLSCYAGYKLQPMTYPVTLNGRQHKHVQLLFELLLQRLLTERRCGFSGAYRVLLDLFLFLVLEIHNRAAEQQSVDALELARLAIEQRFPEHLELPELARDAKLSLSHFCRAFKARYQMSPIALQKMLRVQAAENLLSSSGLSCKEIGAYVGFRDTYTFSKAFKRHFGVSPRNFALRHARRPAGRIKSERSCISTALARAAGDAHVLPPNDSDRLV